jgi:hypothetical protein
MIRQRPDRGFKSRPCNQNLSSERFCCSGRCFPAAFFLTARKHLPSQIAQARYTLRNREKKIQRSSVVERSAVNRLVVGSNPTAGAIFYSLPLFLSFALALGCDFVDA